MQQRPSIFTREFILLCLSGFLFFGSFNMILPELPSYLSTLGGAEYKGLIIAVFTLTAGLSRPLSGKLADKIGRVPVMVVGALVSGIAALIYPIVAGVLSFFILRFFHGFSTGFKPTGTSAYVADIVPADRRGEAMGYLGSFSGLGMSAGPAFGSYVANHLSLNIMFYISCGTAILSVAILIGMKETLSNREKLAPRHFMITKNDFFEPRVIAPSIVTLLSVFSFGAIHTVIPDVSDHLNMVNRGLFLTYFTLASMIVRLVAGKISDIWGRVRVLKFGTFFLIPALICIAIASSEFSLSISAIFYGFGVGVVSPTLYAWTIDLSDVRHRGRGIATMYIALELGIGLGALISGWLYANDMNKVSWVFYLCAFVQLVAFIYLYSKPVKRTGS